MERFLREVFFIIKYIDRFQLDNTVGLDTNFPQIFLIPDKENMVQEVHPYSLRGINDAVDKMLDNWREGGISRLLQADSPNVP